MTARSRITSQGQVSVPAEVRRRLGVGAGGLLVWSPAGDGYVVRRSGGKTFTDAHAALGLARPERRTATELREGVREHVRRKHGPRARG